MLGAKAPGASRASHVFRIRQRAIHMDIGLMIDGDYGEGQTQHEAFDNALSTAELAETLGFDSIWLAERHFSAPRSGALIPSIASSPLLLATAIAMRTSRIRIGTAVLLLPLGHPVRMAEEVGGVGTAACSVHNDIDG
jgi:alkanesulfonate monooxygenase SsuD/methylene tetrahydromethanopterin reductase-like flavin-dependent oxidoreductase (luciferase family)